MIKKHSHWWRGASSSGLLPVAIISNYVHLVSNAHQEAEVVRQWSFNTPAILVYHPEVRQHIAHETKKRDEVWSQPHGQTVYNEIADVLQNVVIIYRVVSSNILVISNENLLLWLNVRTIGSKKPMCFMGFFIWRGHEFTFIIIIIPLYSSLL